MIFWNNKMRLNLLLILFHLCLTSVVFTQTNNALAYSIKGENNTVYLLGSIHLGHPDFYPFADPIEQAFVQSPYLVVEVDIRSSETMEQVSRINEYAMLEKGITLRDLLSEELYRELNAILAEYNLPIEYFHSYKPWFMTILLPALQFTDLGYSEEQGVDLYFLQKAQGKKEILQLETFQEQIEMLEGMNDIAYLEYTIETMNEAEDQSLALIDAWSRGDEADLEEILLSDMENTDFDMSAIYEKLYTERNIKMYKKIKTFLKGHKDYFVVVGAGHLIGEEGIVSLMEDDGMTVERFRQP